MIIGTTSQDASLMAVRPSSWLGPDRTWPTLGKLSNPAALSPPSHSATGPPSSYEELWRKQLYRIAQRPGKPLRRKDFSTALTPIRLLRNRIAHHEPILEWNLPKHYRNMVHLTKWLSPSAAAWCIAHCRFDGDGAPEATT